MAVIWHSVAFSWLLATAGHADTPTGQLLPNVSFTRFASESSYGELARRLLSPADAEHFERQLEAAQGTLANQPLDPADETFLVYVPARKPEQGYALLVFVPPWQKAHLPAHWAPVLDQHGVIFVTAARSGNEESAMARREPLALLAAHNLMQTYPINPQQVFVGGFSGGSRVALRLALGYPDLFRGAFLNAGSDVVGDGTAVPPVPLPPRDLLYRFQESTRLVYATGEHDSEHLDDDRLSVRSLVGWCVYNVRQFEIPRLDHSIADPSTLARALDVLVGTEPTRQDELDHCRQVIDSDMDAQFRKVEALVAVGKGAAAERVLAHIDRKYGGLAAARRQQFAPAHRGSAR